MMQHTYALYCHLQGHSLHILKVGIWVSVCMCVFACKLAGFLFFVFFPQGKQCFVKNFVISRPNLSFHLFHRCLTVLIKNFWSPIGHLTNV